MPTNVDVLKLVTDLIRYWKLDWKKRKQGEKEIEKKELKKKKKKKSKDLDLEGVYWKQSF